MNKRSLSQRIRPSYGKGNYRGVNWHKKHKHWQVCIKVDEKNKYFGNFDNELDGLDAVNKAYAKYFPNNPELQQATHKERLLNINNATCGKW